MAPTCEEQCDARRVHLIIGIVEFRAYRAQNFTSGHLPSTCLDYLISSTKWNSVPKKGLQARSGDGVWATKKVKQKERRPKCEDGVVAIVVHLLQLV
ncbi:hypothetical protein HPP92_028620 [Vanilla planifolia]|uniref:Uncharacterized protein n=1 Tax=Vanilla planifolia TaxID=51239 RepID=A0A835P4R3_VANPL|nr:hypothetical protein HPP92_028620 [Vanilla planifolia]